MPIQVVKNELPRAIRQSVARTIASLFPDNAPNSGKEWSVSLTTDLRNHAWDVEVSGPRFHWARRFSGDDRDADVIAEAIREALPKSGRTPGDSAPSQGLNDALSALASQGIAFTSTAAEAGERKYVVDRVELKESEIVYLHNQGALTTDGIRRYLLTR